MLKPMVIIFSILMLMGCLPEDPREARLAWQNTAYQPIVNGTREPQAVDLTDAQIMAIGWLHPVGFPSRMFCTGTIVAPDLVMTAAHCVYGVSADEIGFGVGVDPEDPDGGFQASAIYINRQVDAAMILLDQDVTGGELEITPIAVNSDPIDSSAIGRAVQAGGYGETADSSLDGRYFATVYIYSVESDEIVVDGRGEQGICFGDSGSGLIDLDGEGNPVVLAVEHGGDESCVDLDYMTRLDTIYDWIGPILAGEVPEDPCDGVGREGRCVENILETCPRGTLQYQDCTLLGTECEYIEEAERYACICGDLGQFEWCNGDFLESCREGRIVSRNCTFRAETCGWVDDEEGYDCVNTAVCRPEDLTGRCEGDTLVRCSDGNTTRELCPVEGLVCVQTEEEAGCFPPEEGDETEDLGGDVAEPDDWDLSDGQGFPDVGDLTNDANGGPSATEPTSDDCSGCATAPSSSAGFLLWASLALFGYSARRRRGVRLGDHT